MIWLDVVVGWPNNLYMKQILLQKWLQLETRIRVSYCVSKVAWYIRSPINTDSKKVRKGENRIIITVANFAHNQ